MPGTPTTQESAEDASSGDASEDSASAASSVVLDAGHAGKTETDSSPNDAVETSASDDGVRDDASSPGLGTCPPAPSGWRPMASIPMAVSDFRGMVWSGKELLLLERAGSDPPTGYTFSTIARAYDPVLDRWRELTVPSFGTMRSDFDGAVWTGHLWILWGGLEWVMPSKDFDFSPSVDGFAYDPVTRTWSSIEAAPLSLRLHASVIWAPTTGELIVWGGAQGGIMKSDGAAYDPVKRTWRMLPPAPLPGGDRATIMWVHDRVLIAYPGLDDGDGVIPQLVIAAYDPVTDTWTSMPDSPITARLLAVAHPIGATSDLAAILGGTACMCDGDSPDLRDGAFLDLAARRWTSIPAPSSTFFGYSREGMSSWSANGKLYVWGGLRWDAPTWDLGSSYRDDGAVFDPATRVWTPMPDGGPTGREVAWTVWTGCDAIVYGGVNGTSRPNDGMLFRP